VERSLQKRKELLYAIKTDQEGLQSQGLSTIFKLLKERYGEQENHSGGFHMFGTMKEVLRGRRISSDEEVISTVQNWLNTQPKKTFF
jgi:hypothetical protein